MKKILSVIILLFFVSIPNIKAAVKIGVTADNHFDRVFYPDSADHADTLVTNLNTVPDLDVIISMGDIYQGAYNPHYPWESGIAYTGNSSLCVYNNTLYVCIASHTSSAENKPSEGVNWTDYWEESTVPPLQGDDNTALGDYLADKAIFEPEWEPGTGKTIPVFWVIGNHDDWHIGIENFVNNCRYMPPFSASPNNYPYTLPDDFVVGQYYGNYAFSIENDVRVIVINNITVSDGKVMYATDDTLAFLESALDELKASGAYPGQRAIICCHMRIDPYSTGDTVYDGALGTGSRTIVNVSYTKPYSGKLGDPCTCEDGCDNTTAPFKGKVTIEGQGYGNGFEPPDQCRFVDTGGVNAGEKTITLEDEGSGENEAVESVVGVTVKVSDGFAYRSTNSHLQRQILEAAKDDGVIILGVFQGHAHSPFHTKHNGIDYYTLYSAKNSATYAIVEVQDDNFIDLEGITCTTADPPVCNTNMYSSFNHKVFRKKPYLIFPESNTQMTVVWQLHKTVSTEIKWRQEGAPAWGTPVIVTETDAVDHIHSYAISGLTAGTRYEYHVSSTDLTEEISGTFTTSPSTGTDLTFTVIGNTRSYPNRFNSVAAKMVDAFEIDTTLQTLVIGTGDWVNDGESENDWDYQLFDPHREKAVKMMGSMPLMAAVGDRDVPGVSGTDGLFKKYLPYAYSGSTGEHYYSFDYGPAHFVMADLYVPYVKGSVQYDWIKASITGAGKSWNFICLHESGWSAGNGLKTSGSNNNNTEVQQLIQDLVNDGCDVDAVFAGNNQYYARAEETIGSTNVIHITTGGGGASLKSPDSLLPNITTVSKSYHFTKVAISGTTMTIEYEAIGNDGNPDDCFLPAEGDWVITEDMVYTGTCAAPANVIVKNNALLTISDGAELDIDLLNYYLKVEAGSGVLIQPLGKLY